MIFDVPRYLPYPPYTLVAYGTRARGMQLTSYLFIPIISRVMAHNHPAFVLRKLDRDSRVRPAYR